MCSEKIKIKATIEAMSQQQIEEGLRTVAHSLAMDMARTPAYSHYSLAELAERLIDGEIDNAQWVGPAASEREYRGPHPPASKMLEIYRSCLKNTQRKRRRGKCSKSY